MNQNLDIMLLPIEEAWSIFKVLEADNLTYTKIRFGFNLKFDINDYIKNRITFKNKAGLAIIRGRIIKIEELETELELREKEIKTWLNENYGNKPLTRPRGKNNDN